MADGLSESLGDLLDGSYDCVDRIVLNAYNPWCASPGGFRQFWRHLDGSDEHLDNAHLMRLAGRFSRRVRGAAKARGIPVIDCRRGEKKHQLAEEYLATHNVSRGVFLVLVARAVAPVWEVGRSRSGVIYRLTKKTAYVNFYSFHIMDPEWGHILIKMAGHRPFGAQIILNGHEYVARQASKARIAFRKEGNCFTQFCRPADLARVADTLSDPATIGRLSQVADQWIYSACLCFALDIAEQERTRFSTSTRCISSSTAETCCSGQVARWTRSSSNWWTARVRDCTYPNCGPLRNTRSAAADPEAAVANGRRSGRDLRIRSHIVQGAVRQTHVEGVHQR